jgi:hypothetical protein
MGSSDYLPFSGTGNAFDRVGWGIISTCAAVSAGIIFDNWG